MKLTPVSKAMVEEAKAKIANASWRDRSNAWKRAATAWTAAALEEDDDRNAGVFALRALRALKNADLLRKCKEPI